jgi:16S rRNA (adenine1518-N6/adenine1519-N6)-dimethyltransferase
MTDTTLGARRLRELLDGHGIVPRKELGQNFVIDPNTIVKMVDLAQVGPDDHIVEIGAGAGSLTLVLANRASRVTAVEFDRALIRVLADVVADCNNVAVIQADALRLDIGTIGATALVGNLPYNIAATVVIGALEDASQVRTLTVMTQREVGERLAASPGSKSYGATSVLVAYFGEARVAARVSRRAFFPEPNVDSVIVRIVRHAITPAIAYGRFREVVRTTFSQRRKMVRNTLAGIAGSTSEAEAVLARAGIPAGARPEEIGFEGFAAVAAELS